ncbi:MAG: 50S ribosomal protein L23 [Planctomycetes bacterium]|jgi:large subunit ribosomal protein L23|uniref:50S ribosomal protein L23 n=1 Tax=Candidatus Tripitaka californicus TaxID=3367616 RepID=UPI004025BEC0|nr:50S ribosomal protein L23 [Planctomycetota bacterium]MBI5125633.1 50S ribosomal protein L23 [Planctomycetota bacterium]
MDIYQIIRKPLHTEKSVTDRDKQDAYHFEVDRKANKIQIKEAIEKLFKVEVLKVRTMNKRGKPRRTKYGPLKIHTWKKAVVTLAEGNTIDLGY